MVLVQLDRGVVGASRGTLASDRVSVVHRSTIDRTDIDTDFDESISKSAGTLADTGDSTIISIVVSRTIHGYHTSHVGRIAIVPMRTLTHTILPMDPLAIGASTNTQPHPTIGVIVCRAVGCIDTYPLCLSVVTVQLVVGGSVCGADIDALVGVDVVVGVVGTGCLTAFCWLVFFVTARAV